MHYAWLETEESARNSPEIRQSLQAPEIRGAEPVEGAGHWRTSERSRPYRVRHEREHINGLQHVTISSNVQNVLYTSEIIKMLVCCEIRTFGFKTPLMTSAQPEPAVGSGLIRPCQAGLGRSRSSRVIWRDGRGVRTCSSKSSVELWPLS
jgi:hypothetical protein